VQVFGGRLGLAPPGTPGVWKYGLNVEDDVSDIFEPFTTGRTNIVFARAISTAGYYCADFGAAEVRRVEPSEEPEP
jgi:hypothetical protein